jgi:hypothetical protein
MADTELNVVLRLIDQASSEIKKSMQGVESNTKQTAENTSANWARVTVSVMGVVRAFRFVSQGMQDIIKIGRDIDPVFNKSFNNFENSIFRAKAAIAEKLIPYLKTALDFWTEFLNKSFQPTTSALQYFNTEIEKSGIRIEQLTGQMKVFNVQREIMEGRGNTEAVQNINDRIAATQKLIDMENLRISTMERLKTGQQQQTNVVDEAVKILESNQLLEEQNNKLKEKQALYLAGQISAEQYYTSIMSKEQMLLNENQLRMQTMNEIANLESTVNNKSLTDFIKAQETKKQALQKTFNELTRTQSDSLKLMAQGAQSALGMLESALNGAAAMGKGWAKAAAVVSLAMAIINTAVGITQAFANYPWPFSLVVAGIIAAAGAIQIATIASQKFHKGGMIRAHDGLAVDEVPIIAQTGEGILSRRGMSNLGGAGMLNRLNAGQEMSSASMIENTFNININYPKMSNKEEINELVNVLGMEIQRELSYARG